MPTIHVEVYHNQSRDGFFGLNAVFADGGKRQALTDDERHPLVKVFEYDTEFQPGPNGALYVCERAFEEFNIGEGELAQAYRANRLRSLSVGDVLILGAGIDPVAYSCESCGWAERNPAELNIQKQ